MSLRYLTDTVSYSLGYCCQLEVEPMFIIRQHNGFNTRQGFNEALRLALELKELGWACCIENQKGEVIAE